MTMTRRQAWLYRWLCACGILLVAFAVAEAADATEPVWGCASALFRDRVVATVPAGADLDKILQSSLWVKRVEHPRLQDLPFQLYEVQYTSVRPSVTAYLVADETRCQLVAGDLSELLGEEIGWERQHRFAIEKLNSFLERKDRPVLIDDRALLRYAYAVATVLYIDDPIEILEDVSSLRSIINETAVKPHDDQDQVTARITQALEAYEAPRVWQDQGVRVAEFCSWISLGGAVLRHRVSILSDGTIDEHSDTLVREVGRYTKVRYRM